MLGLHYRGILSFYFLDRKFQESPYQGFQYVRLVILMKKLCVASHNEIPGLAHVGRRSNLPTKCNNITCAVTSEITPNRLHNFNILTPLTGMCVRRPTCIQEGLIINSDLGMNFQDVGKLRADDENQQQNEQNR